MPSATLWAALIAAAAPPSPPPSVLSASEPEPLALLLVAPTGLPGQISRSEAIRAIEEAVGERTELRADPVDPSVNEDCRGRLACIVTTLNRQRPRDRDPAPWLLVVTRLTLEGEPDEVSATLLDLPRAESIVLSSLDPDVEVALDAATTRAPQASIRNSDELLRYVRGILDGVLKDPLARDGRLAARGSASIDPVTTGAVVTLDGRVLGATQSEALEIRRIRWGAHRVELSLPDTVGWAERFELSEARPFVHLTPELAAEEAHLTRTAFAVGGGTLAAAGAAVLVWSAVSASSDVKTACFASDPACTGGSSFVGIGYDSSADTARDVDDGNLGLAPIGAALATVGVGLAVGALLEDGDDVPWWTVALSLAAGGAVLGAGVLLDQGRVP